jgi:hypothetical protein
MSYEDIRQPAFTARLFKTGTCCELERYAMSLGLGLTVIVVKTACGCDGYLSVPRSDKKQPNLLGYSRFEAHGAIDRLAKVQRNRVVA